MCIGLRESHIWVKHRPSLVHISLLDSSKRHLPSAQSPSLSLSPTDHHCPVGLQLLLLQTLNLAVMFYRKPWQREVTLLDPQWVTTQKSEWPWPRWPWRTSTVTWLPSMRRGKWGMAWMRGSWGMQTNSLTNSILSFIVYPGGNLYCTVIIHLILLHVRYLMSGMSVTSHW